MSDPGAADPMAGVLEQGLGGRKEVSTRVAQGENEADAATSVSLEVEVIGIGACS